MAITTLDPESQLDSDTCTNHPCIYLSKKCISVSPRCSELLYHPPTLSHCENGFIKCLCKAWDFIICLKVHCFHYFLDKGNKLIFLLLFPAKESWDSLVDLGVRTMLWDTEKAMRAIVLPPGTPQTCPRAKAAGCTCCFIYLAMP